MKKPQTILTKTKNLWFAVKVIECLLYGLGIGLFVFGLTSLEIALASGFIASILFFFLLKPWKINLHHVASLYDLRLENVENSTGILLREREELPLIARLQYEKLAGIIAKSKILFPPNHLTRATFFIVLMMALGFVINQILPKPDAASLVTLVPDESEDIIENDSITPVAQPKIESIQLYVSPPAYTGLRASTSSDLNINAVEQSWLTWTVKTNKATDRVFIETSGKSTQELVSKEGVFKISAKVSENGFYNFKLVGADGREFTSELYSIEAIEDTPPSVELKGIKQYTSFSYFEKKRVNITSLISDDFGLTDAYIIATVTQGTGESVKFREEKLDFDKKARGTQVLLNKTIDLDEMKMSPGDELYFYVEAIDNKKPDHQRSRTETYFLNIKDTTDIEFSLAGSLGVDLMPEYFRSQRQIIIDTEKLIAERQKMQKKDFNSQSNELGFDQKSLRLKYGQFMGVENESGIAIETEEIAEELEEDHDPLAEYSHDHDGDNEHNLVVEDDHDHGHEDEHDKGNMLDKYIHAHDDPEEATLYTQSTRSMLKQAMAEMWDAELYLRLFEPEKSLPYQYKALELIKKIKNQARIYVHRIGFDPPPIKEDKRLTGDLDEVKSRSASEDATVDDGLDPLRNLLNRIATLNRGDSLQKSDYQLFAHAADALSPLAVEQPVKYLESLENLKKLSNNEFDPDNLKKVLANVSRALVQAIPPEVDNFNIKSENKNQLTRTYLDKLSEVINE
ncbi:tryptophan-rich sensory protein [Fulvivirga sp. RKSG066]|uniref:tryptophan-rich sensory protein n=1 Tax=Fulvivirga aurantia TaxID=2529383 RepID=UPI0012BCBA02|nr:tryptophan-rich sensory protein [Fulvivirga aurantia]MTI23056.1 tryptophan-rich sensory protein [Fulvivirga aurantia]